MRKRKVKQSDDGGLDGEPGAFQLAVPRSTKSNCWFIGNDIGADGSPALATDVREKIAEMFLNRET